MLDPPAGAGAHAAPTNVAGRVAKHATGHLLGAASQWMNETFRPNGEIDSGGLLKAGSNGLITGSGAPVVGLHVAR